MTLLPTLNRTKLLRRFLDSAVACETSTPVWVLVDEEDFNKKVLEYGLNYPELDLTVHVTKSVKMGDKIREVWPMVLDTGTTWVNILNDDHIIKTKEWDKKLISKLDGTNFVTCQDNWMSPRKAAGATMFSMELLKAVGFQIYPPGMIHLFIDDLWEAIGRGTGCWDIDHSVVIEHENQLKHPDQRDSTFYEVYGRTQQLNESPIWKNDEKIYQNIMKNDFISIRNNIRKLKGQLEIKTHS